MKIDSKEVSNIARVARIAVTPQELEQLGRQLEDVLSYAQQVVAFVDGYQPALQEQCEQRNVLREDVPASCPVQEIFSQAPLVEENYFVVPKILETTK